MIRYYVTYRDGGKFNPVTTKRNTFNHKEALKWVKELTLQGWKVTIEGVEIKS